MDKRKIYLGFEQPSTLEGNIIYVSFRLQVSEGVEQRSGGVTYVNLNLSGTKVITAEAVSNEDFVCHDRSLDGSHLTLTRKQASTYTGSVSHSWHRDYNEFLEDLVKSNDVVLDYSRLIKEGADAYEKCARVRAVWNPTTAAPCE